jgi:thymidylate synthase (methanogen type)
MRVVKTNNLGQAWRKIFNEVYQHGKTLNNNNKGQIKELIDLLVVMQNVEKDSFIRKHGDKKIIKWMKDNFGKIIPVENWGYSYGQRLYNFLGVDQIEVVIKKLKKNPNSKSATINLMLAPNDKKHVPCLAVLDFKIRSNKLITTAFFRSQDVGKKFYADGLAIKEVSKKIAKKISVPLGEFVLFIKSAHFYVNDTGQLKNTFKL